MNDLLRASFVLVGVWSLIHLVQDRFRPSGATSTLTVAGLSLHWSTTRLNPLPLFILNPLRSRHGRKNDKAVRWRAFWDTGALAGVAGVLVAQAVLVWATWASVRVLVVMVFGSREPDEGLVGALVRRGIERRAAAGAASGLVLRPMVRCEQQGDVETAQMSGADPRCNNAAVHAPTTHPRLVWRTIFPRAGSCTRSSFVNRHFMPDLLPRLMLTE